MPVTSIGSPTTTVNLSRRHGQAFLGQDAAAAVDCNRRMGILPPGRAVMNPLYSKCLNSGLIG